MDIGEIRVDGVVDGTFMVEAARMWPHGLPDRVGAAAAEATVDDGLLVEALGGFLVRTGDRVVLIDAGAGPADEAGPATPPYRTWVDHGQLVASLAALGVATDDVTDVVFTHLHFDHIGWASHAGRTTFARARHWCDERDAAHFLGPDAVDETSFRTTWGAIPAVERLAPVLDHLDTWDDDVSIAPGVDVRRAPGHTPGSSVVVLSSGTARALVLGDVVHCPLELLDLDWAAAADLDPAMARRTREALERELMGPDVLVGAPHFPGLEFGRVLPGEGRRQWLVGAA